ncbi:MAG: hypothetical protein ACKOS8_18035, partial [Gemmataceae bacterium]
AITSNRIDRFFQIFHPKYEKAKSGIWTQKGRLGIKTKGLFGLLYVMAYEPFSIFAGGNFGKIYQFCWM